MRSATKGGQKGGGVAEGGRGSGGKGRAPERVALTAQAELPRFRIPTIQRDASRPQAPNHAVTRDATRLCTWSVAEGGRLRLSKWRWRAMTDGRLAVAGTEGARAQCRRRPGRRDSHGPPRMGPWRASSPTAAKRCERWCPRWIMFPAGFLSSSPNACRRRGQSRLYITSILTAVHSKGCCGARLGRFSLPILYPSSS